MKTAADAKMAVEWIPDRRIRCSGCYPQVVAQCVGGDESVWDVEWVGDGANVHERECSFYVPCPC